MDEQTAFIRSENISQDESIALAPTDQGYVVNREPWIQSRQIDVSPCPS